MPRYMKKPANIRALAWRGYPLPSLEPGYIGFGKPAITSQFDIAFALLFHMLIYVSS